MIELPEYARVVRALHLGNHAYGELLPRFAESPAARRIESATMPLQRLLTGACVRIEKGRGYVWVDEEAPAIVLVQKYYQSGDPLDLYLDLIHELTHLRQLAEGQDIWNEQFRYVDRPTEIEGYAIAIEEGLRLGMTEARILDHLSNPWMTSAEVRRLRENIRQFLSGRPGP